MTAFETESSWSPQTVQTQETPWARQASTASDLEEESVQETTGSDHELESPFLSSLSFLEAAKGSQLTADPGISATLESPFLSGFTTVSEMNSQGEGFKELLAELESEEFEEAVNRLVDEAAGMHLASHASWSSDEAAPSLAMAELETWIEPLRNEADRMLSEMADRFANEEIDTLREVELDNLLESMRPESGFLPAAFEDFLGGLFNKARSLVKGAWNLAKKGVEVAGKFFPISWILGKLGGLVKPMLLRVLQQAIGKLPPSLQPVAKGLADRFLAADPASADPSVKPGGVAQEFDLQAASLLFMPTEAEQDRMVAEAEAEAGLQTRDVLAELDGARALLGEQLTTLPTGSLPQAELEQFIPAVMAALPVIRLGIGVIGRDRVVGFLADRIASLIGGQVGPEAAKALARPIVSAGLGLLRLEAPQSPGTALAGEALASTVEETVRHVLELPAEAFEDTLRMEMEVQQAFTGAAARNIPADLLRPDLPERETAGEGGVWILMPRAARPRFRYKKYSRVFLVPISRQTARAISTTDGRTLEAQLLDRGVGSWPVDAEVHLYEAVPGCRLGHIARFEGEADVPTGEAQGEVEVQPLTPEVASLLVREPGLGTASATGGAASLAGLPRTAPSPSGPAPRPGQRFYAVRLPGQARMRTARPRRRLRLVFDVLGRTPQIRVHLHLSEREGQQLGERLHRGDLVGVTGWLKHQYQRTAPAVLAMGLLKQALRMSGPAVDVGTVAKAATGMAEALTTALTAFLKDRKAELANAVRDPAQGITITFTFTAPDRAALLQPGLPTPAIVVKPGWRHG